MAGCLNQELMFGVLRLQLHLELDAYAYGNNGLTTSIGRCWLGLF